MLLSPMGSIAAGGRDDSELEAARQQIVRADARGIEEIAFAWEAGLENGRAIGKTVVARFASPIVDDQGLIIADALARRPVWKSNFGCPTPSTRRVPVAASARWYNNTHRSRASSRRGSKS